MKLTWLAGLAAMVIPTVAQAHWHGGWGFSFGIGISPAYYGPTYATYYAPPPVVYSSPAPVYASPAPEYVSSAPVYVPPPVVYAPPPVVYSPGYFYGPRVYVGYGGRYPYYRSHYYYRR